MRKLYVVEARIRQDDLYGFDEKTWTLSHSDGAYIAYEDPDKAYDAIMDLVWQYHDKGWDLSESDLVIAPKIGDWYCCANDYDRDLFLRIVEVRF